jgi:hypothetical protein
MTERCLARVADVTVAGGDALRPLLAASLAIHARAAVDPERAARWAEGVRSAREEWVTDFGGAQFSLGRAWYTHLEQGRAGDYFAASAASDRTVEGACPGLQDAMRALASRIVGAPVVTRPGWCGPGVHIFPAKALVATRGGDVHFDTEGLTPAHASEHAPALTLVLMLEPPTRGGGLRVWDLTYSGSDAYEDEDLERPHVTCVYGPGDLVVIDSYRLHQIQPFEGAVDRISATCHAAYVAGQWETWF